MAGRVTDLVTRLIANDQASKVIDKVADRADKLEKTKVEIPIEADDKATPEIKELDSALDRLSKEDVRLVLNAQAKDAQRDIDRITRSLAQLDKMDREEIDIRVDALGNARAELEAIDRKIDELDREEADVTVDADTSRATTALGKFKADFSSATGVGGKLGVGAKALWSNFGSYATEGAAVAAAAIAGFVAKSTNQFQDLALEVGKARDALGVTAEEASRLREVSEDLGVPFNTLQGAIQKMNRTAANTPQVFEEAGAGIATSRTGAVDTYETFLNVIEALDAMPDASQRAAAGQAILGKSWSQLSELVTMGSDDVRAALDEVGAGKIVTDEQIDQARAMRDSLDGLADRGDEFANSIGRTVMPMVTQLADALGLLADGFGQVIKLSSGDVGVPVLDQWLRYGLPVIGQVHMFTDAIGGARKEIDDLRGVTHGSVGAIATLSDGLTDAERAAEQAQAVLDRQAARTKDVYESATEGAERIELFGKAQADAAEETQAHVDALREEAELLEEQAASFEDAADLTREVNKLRRQQVKLNKDENATVADRVDLAIRLANTEADRIEAVRRAAGQTVTATQKIEQQNSALVDQVAQLRGPSRQALLDYIGNLNGIPPRKLSRIEALIAAGKLDAAKRLLNNASASRTATIQAQANTAEAEGELNYLARDREVLLLPRVGADPIRRGGGGPVYHDGAVLVGEHGPELVTLPGGSYVHAAAQTQGMLRASSTTSVANVTINTAVVGNEFDVQRTVRQALRKSERINGSRRYP